MSGIWVGIRRKRTQSVGFAATSFAVLCAAVLTAAAACSGLPTTAAAAKSTPASAAPAASITSTSATPAVTGARPGCTTSTSLPKDEAPHSAPVEWWYFSGHLSGTAANGHVHTYGYEDVVFQFLGLTPQPIYFGDLAITDLTGKTFHFAGEQDSYAVPKTAGRFALHAGSWTMSGGSGVDTLTAGMPGYSLNLGLHATEPAVIEGNKCGYISMASLGSSYYYSWTSLATAGTVTDHGVTLKVTGKSWMDHQWGQIAITGGGSGGWDWFSMQLSNGQQYMLFFIKNAQGQIVDTAGTQVAAGGSEVTYLTAAGLGEKATGSWTSPATHITYGSGWTVTVPGGQLTVTPDLPDQEVDLLKTQMNVYWEGDVTVTGTIGGAPVSGDGYTELVPPAP